MANEKTDPGGVGLQIDPPSRCTSPTRQPEANTSFLMPNLPKALTLDEKKYLLSVERGDLANVRRILQRAHRREHIDINCVDSLGRGSLTIAIDGENLEMVELLVIMGVHTKDALLQAINAEFVEAVELLLEHEELIHLEGDPYSWQKVEANTSMFTSDMTPLVLAAHRNNYEILKILLDRGASIPMPHDIRCGCADCIIQSAEDSLRHSLSRVNEYRALSSPSLIALSSNDPLLTAFQLSWELRNLAFAEQECKAEYLELRKQCQKFAVDLLDQSRSSKELAIILNYDPEAPPYEDGDHMQLARLELAIGYKQKKFVAHPNIQQLLAALWYEGVPGFRRKSSLEKMFIIVRVALLFPLYCLMYMVAPGCRFSRVLKKPFMKFLVHASSYLFFLFILIMVSQRAEVHLVQMFGTESMKRQLEEQMRRQRGNAPTNMELLVALYVVGFIWEETQEIFREGIRRYLRNMWNFIDFSRNFLYTLVGILRVVAYYQQRQEIEGDAETAFIPREKWNDYDPQLIAEGLFAAANIFSALKLVHLFSINPHLGPLQVSLGRMVIDIVKFFFIYTLVLFAFACGLNQLLWYFADLEKRKCFVLPQGEADWENAGDSCMKWRRFGNLFESSQSLFWASFGMVGLESFELEGIKTYTRFWGLLMFGSYSVINVIVLLNLLIAMMSNSYAMIDEQSDTEWKFARTKLWMSYFDDGATLPPPFNVLPNVKWITRWFRTRKRHSIKHGSTIRRCKEDRENRYTQIMRSLVWRYVSAKHRRDDENAVTEDDINEVKCEISAMRYEMLEIFERNGMDISSAEKRKEKDGSTMNAASMGKKVKIWERRLMKDFQVAPIQTDEDAALAQQLMPTVTAQSPTRKLSLQQQSQQQQSQQQPNVQQSPVSTAAPAERGIARFRRIAQQVVDQTTSHKWGVAVRGVRDTQIGRCHNRESFKNQQNLRRAIQEAKRLIERGASPNRSTSPVLYNDPQASTLLALLRNISEEVEEYEPQTENNTQHRTNRIAANGRQSSPNSLARGPMGNTVPKASAVDDGPNANIPFIQISRTESHVEPLPDASSATSTKLLKRRAPEPQASGPSAGLTSVPQERCASVPPSISRPVARLNTVNAGLIPPPPSSTTTTATTISETCTAATEPSRSRSPSPSCLRAHRKIDDVTTVKRAPKNGWL